MISKERIAQILSEGLPLTPEEAAEFSKLPMSDLVEAEKLIADVPTMKWLDGKRESKVDDTDPEQ